MSKTDMVKRLSNDANQAPDWLEEKHMPRKSCSPKMMSPEHREELEVLLELISEREHYKASSFGETMALLKHVRDSTKEAAKTVERSAREVRNYPAEVVGNVTGRMELCAQRCEQAATRAHQVFDETSDMQRHLSRWALWTPVMSSLFASMLTASFVIWSLR